MVPRRRTWAWIAALGIGLVLALATPAARAGGKPSWTLGFSYKCASGDLCLGFTSGEGSCAFVGGANAGDEADCAGTFASGLGILAIRIDGTAWDIETSPTTGADDFFIPTGTIVYSGSEVVLLNRIGVPAPPGCTASGQTITCDIVAVTLAGLYDPDTLNAATPGHTLTNLCFDTGAIDPGCTFNQQATQVP